MDCSTARRRPPARDASLVVTAGTADRPVADECLLTLTAHGFAPDRLDDVGVAGLHRLLAHVDTITAADAVVVLAGMEGALASVVGGLTGAPVVAVPTSVGYGASLEGVTALLAMHASCAAGVTVVGIDNGYGAACAIAPDADVTTAYVNCSAGVAGDMLLGAFVDAGADPDEIAATVAGLGLDGYAIAFEQVQRGGIAATFANVVTEVHGHEHRTVSAIAALLDAADLPERVRADAHRVFAVLADAEGAVHGIDPGDVELHEVGSLDAIVDVVGTVAALQSLGVEHIVSSPIAVGHGVVRASHGDLPNPPPAVARLLATRAVPIVGVETTMELSTPTGVALLVALADRFGTAPAMGVDNVGYGAGTADPPGRPNVVQVLVGTATVASATPRPGRAAMQLEVNVDDVTGEVLAHTITAAIAAGAHDAWATPIVMKKGRPAHTVAALVDPAAADAVAAVLLSETGSLGIRAVAVERWPQQRHETVVDVDGHPIRVKVASGRAKPEHDDAAKAAAALGRPLRDVLRRAETLALG